MKDSYSFLAILRQSVIHNKRLRIPEGFVEKYKDELGGIVKLSLPVTGTREWAVHLRKGNKELVWFVDGLESFLEDNSIGLNYLMLFKYTNNSCFIVHVFDLTATEIAYPVQQPRSGPKPASSGGNELMSPEQNIYCSYGTRNEVGELKENSFDSEGGSPTSDFETNNTFEDIIPEREERGEGKPYFAVEIKQYQVNRYRLYVTSRFAKRLLPQNPNYIYLVDQNEKRRKVNCTFTSGRVSDLDLGWHRFAEENQVVEGNVCVFEEVDVSPSGKPVLKVHKFPSLTLVPPQFAPY